MRSHHHRRHILALATFLLPLPAFATTYNLSNQSINLATAPYTAADTLNTSSVTFTSSLSAVTLSAAVNLLYTTTINSPNNITFTAPLSGSGPLQKTGTGTLILSAPSPSFTGQVTINSGSFVRLNDPAALGPVPNIYPITLSGTLDATGSLPSRPLYITSTGLLANNSSTPFTLGPSVSLSLDSSSSYLGLGGTGNLTFATPFPSLPNGALSKTGTGTVTYSTPTQFRLGVNVYAGTLRLGIESPFTNPNSLGPVSVGPGAILDLNGFNTTGIGISLGGGGTVSNNNPTTTSNLPSFPTGTAVFGGTGNINLTAKAGSFTKNDTGTLILSAANSSFAGTLTLNDGTLQLNASNSLGNSSSAAIHLNYNSTTQVGGTLDLNGYPAPNATYYFSGGVLENNNVLTPSHVDFSALHIGSGSNNYLTFDGAGNLDVAGTIPPTWFKLGAGALILNTPQIFNGNVDNGSLRLASPGFSNYSNGSSTLTLYGFNVGTYFNNYGPGGLLDIYGNTGGFPSLKLYNNTGIVNNATGTTVTYTGFVSIDSTNQPHNLSFGGDGNFVIPPNGGISLPTTLTLNKVGAGLLTMPSYFSPRGVALRGGTLQVEANNQVGGNAGTISFLGGTLLISPLYLPPQSSYTFTPSLSVDPSTGGTLDTERNSLFTGSLSGSGPFTKTGSASATLNLSPSSRLSLTIAAGTLHLSSPSTPALTSLTLSGGSLDIASAGLILSYTTTSPLPALLPFLASHQLYSSTADADPNHLTTLAYLDTGSSLNFSLAPLGDANLDGRITSDDYALLDRGFAKHLTTWQNGDFNYDGIIDQSDYLLLDRSYLLTTSTDPASLLSQRESQFGPTYVSNLLASLPEPSLALLSLFTLPLLRRRK